MLGGIRLLQNGSTNGFYLCMIGLVSSMVSSRSLIDILKMAEIIPIYVSM